MANVDALFNAIADNPMAVSAFWQNLFYDNVYAQNDPEQDDLIFYVRNGPVLDANGQASPMFVRRKTEPNSILTDDEATGVRWKETFYLNFIVQLPFQLTVAICTKTITPEGKATMTALRHVTRRVYASPNKTRMDQKGFDYIVSYPLIYFMIEDFEDAFANISIKENEYFCIELFVTLPPQRSMETGSLTGSERKVTVFQGAVNWEALAATFQKQSQLNNGSFKDRIEYIMMRGPRNKGHAQVAVSQWRGESASAPVTPSASTSGTLRPSNSEQLKAGLLRGFAQLKQTLTGKPEVVTQLKCWLTFVNISWQSIINDVASVALKNTGKTKEPEIEPNKA